MTEKQLKTIVNTLIWLIGLTILWIVMVCMSGKIYKQQSALIETGVKVEATAEIVKHKGIMEWGKRYARLDYEVDGEPYSSDVVISMRNYQIPGGKVKDGKTVVTAYYDAENPGEIGFEGAQSTAKTARTVSIVLLCLSGALTLFLVLGLVAYKYAG